MIDLNGDKVSTIKIELRSGEVLLFHSDYNEDFLKITQDEIEVKIDFTNREGKLYKNITIKQDYIAKSDVTYA